MIFNALTRIIAEIDFFRKTVISSASSTQIEKKECCKILGLLKLLVEVC